VNTHLTTRPGRTAAPAVPVVHAPHAALLIDFDNVTLGIRSDLTKELRTLLGSEIIKGKVAVQRAYADWRRYPQYIVPLSESSIDLIFAPAFGTNKKNATDIRLAVDAIELVFTRPEIGTFILLSGDSDFSSLVIKLKEYGKYVIGVGIRESASDLLIQNCDEYYSYSDLAGLTKEVDTPSAQRDAWELVVEATEQMARNKDVMRSDRLKQVMQQIDSNFDEKNAGFNRFSKFVTEAGNRGLITVTKLQNGQYEVSPAAGVPAPSARPAAKAAAATVPAEGGAEGAKEGRGRRRGGRGRGRDRPREPGEAAAPERPPAAAATEGPLSLAEAFQLMQRALGELRAPVPHEKLRARMVALQGREDPLLDASRFARLLRQANDAEVADVRKTGDESYDISPHRIQAAAQRAHDALGGPPTRATEAEAEAPRAVTPAEAKAEAQAETAADRVRRLAAVRFRRGSRSTTRSISDIPLVGAVRMEPEHHHAPVGAVAAVEAKVPEKKAKAARPGRSKRATAGPVQAEEPQKPRRAKKAATTVPAPVAAIEVPVPVAAAKKGTRRGHRGGRGRGKPKVAPTA